MIDVSNLFKINFFGKIASRMLINPRVIKTTGSSTEYYTDLITNSLQQTKVQNTYKVTKVYTSPKLIVGCCDRHSKRVH